MKDKFKQILENWDSLNTSSLENRVRLDAQKGRTIKNPKTGEYPNVKVNKMILQFGTDKILLKDFVPLGDYYDFTDEIEKTQATSFDYKNFESEVESNIQRIVNSRDFKNLITRNIRNKIPNPHLGNLYKMIDDIINDESKISKIIVEYTIWNKKEILEF